MPPPDKPENSAAVILDKYGDPNWRLAHKMWSMRVAAFWAVVCGIWIALPAFQNWVKPIPFVCICIFFSLLIMVARMTGQPGIPDI